MHYSYGKKKRFEFYLTFKEIFLQNVKMTGLPWSERNAYVRFFQLSMSYQFRGNLLQSICYYILNHKQNLTWTLQQNAVYFNI